MKTHSKANSKANNFERDRRMKKVGKAVSHKPKYKKNIFQITED